MKNLIITRHNSLVEYLKLEGIQGEVISHVADPSILEGRDVYGVLPLSLASKCNTITEVSMPNLLPEQRGKELSIEEMNKAGAHLVTYTVRRVK